MIKEKLKAARTHKGLSQEELADLIGMTQPNYSRRESGKHTISITEWTKIAKELGVKKEDIYEEDTINIVYKGNKGSVNNSGTIHFFNMPDFMLEHIELLKNQNKVFKEENRMLKERLKSYENE